MRTTGVYAGPVTTPVCPVCDQPASDGYICHGCTQRLRVSLRAVSELLEELDTTLSRQDRIGSPQEGIAAEKPLPMNVGASAAKSTLLASLHGWARCLSEDTGHAITGTPWEWLADNTLSVRMRDWAPDAVLELIGPPGTGDTAVSQDVIGRAWRAVDRPDRLVFIGVCPCGVELRARRGEGIIRCYGCGVSADVEETRERLLDSAAGQELGAADIARALSTEDQPVTAAMVRGWALTDARTRAKGGPAGFGPVRLDPPKYRLGDALERLRGARIGAMA